jgi:FkbM family methyltransferase
MPTNRMIDGQIVGDRIGRYEAGQKFRPVETIEFVDQQISGRWVVRIPKFLAEYHGWWDTWEKERHFSMFDHLKAGMLFYEVGASDGWQSAFYASMIGGASNMVLIEPTTELWPNIKAILEHNNLSLPRATYMGFCGERNIGNDSLQFSAWPEGPDYSQFVKGQMFSCLGYATQKPCRTLDSLAVAIGEPDALNIDVEGAELLVLQGAEKTLKEKHPLIWLSIHPEMMETFGHTPRMLFDFMEHCGYRNELLAVDHEQHFFFY